MRRRKCEIFYLLILLYLIGCTEPFEPELDVYEDLLVVDALITNLPGPYYVELSRTYPYKNGEEEKEYGAEVTILDNLGNEYLFVEEAVGEYKNIDNSFIGQVGREYKLIIVTKDGEVFESDFEELKKPVDIEELSFKFKRNELNGERGMQIYLNAHDPDNSTTYYAWSYYETWEFAVPFDPNNMNPPKKICYKEEQSNELIVASTENHSEDRFINHPLYNIGYDTDKLKRRYSSLVYQYTLNAESYQFLQNLKMINEGSGSLYNAPPASITGNICNVNNPDEPVLGLFQVSGASSKRFFIDNTQVAEIHMVYNDFAECDNVMVTYPMSNEDLITYLTRAKYIIMDTVLIPPPYINLVSHPRCFDCTLSGSFTIPDFWNEFSNDDNQLK